MGRSGKGKGRSNRTYENKKRKITKWYNNIEKNRQEKNGKGKPKKPLKPLQFFLDQLKKPNKSSSSSLI
jgi:hypothetical protein